MASRGRDPCNFIILERQKSVWPTLHSHKHVASYLNFSIHLSRSPLSRASLWRGYNRWRVMIKDDSRALEVLAECRVAALR
jgi:hypothetical protein